MIAYKCYVSWCEQWSETFCRHRRQQRTASSGRTCHQLGHMQTTQHQHADITDQLHVVCWRVGRLEGRLSGWLRWSTGLQATRSLVAVWYSQLGTWLWPPRPPRSVRWYRQVLTLDLQQDRQSVASLYYFTVARVAIAVYFLCRISSELSRRMPRKSSFVHSADSM